jgi:hypothetical protein
MSTSKVSKYNKHNDIIIMNISISNSSNPPTVHQAYYKMTSTQDITHTRECHGDSNRYTPYRGRNLTYTSYAWLQEALTYDNHSQVPTKSKLGPCSQDKVLALDLIPPLKSTSTTRSREVRFDKVVTKATRLTGPHKTRHAVSTQLKACHRGQNDAVLNWHKWGLPHRNLGIATTLSLALPFRVFHWSPTCPTRSSNSK